MISRVTEENVLDLRTANRIATDLRNSILQGSLKSEQKLNQNEIAERYGVSKIPVREALSHLQAEGLITFHTNRGAFVSRLSSREVDEIYVMRIALERAALERAIPHLTVAEMAHAEEILTTIDMERNAAHWGELNWEFHAVLYAPADLPRLMDTLKVLHANVARYLVLYLAGMDYQEQSQAEHRRILEACRHGKIDEALNTLTLHLQDAADNLTRKLAQQETEGV